ncbi:phage holin [Lysinibacillus capsici]|nr:phage holin [Lysinibacillus capsici]
MDTVYLQQLAQATAIFNTILSILILLGIVIDPTTSDVSDSVQVLK